MFTTGLAVPRGKPIPDRELAHLNNKGGQDATASIKLPGGVKVLVVADGHGDMSPDLQDRLFAALKKFCEANRRKLRRLTKKELVILFEGFSRSFHRTIIGERGGTTCTIVVVIPKSGGTRVVSIAWGDSTALVWSNGTLVSSVGHANADNREAVQDHVNACRKVGKVALLPHRFLWGREPIAPWVVLGGKIPGAPPFGDTGDFITYLRTHLGSVEQMGWSNENWINAHNLGDLVTRFLSGEVVENPVAQATIRKLIAQDPKYKHGVQGNGEGICDAQGFGWANSPDARYLCPNLGTGIPSYPGAHDRLQTLVSFGDLGHKMVLPGAYTPEVSVVEISSTSQLTIFLGTDGVHDVIRPPAILRCLNEGGSIWGEVLVSISNWWAFGPLSYMDGGVATSHDDVAFLTLVVEAKVEPVSVHLKKVVRKSRTSAPFRPRWPVAAQGIRKLRSRSYRVHQP
jgi:serine/threonine protein phosphatase PrpC